jgi:hypothetical protein
LDPPTPERAVDYRPSCFPASEIQASVNGECPRAGNGVGLLKRAGWIGSRQLTEVLIVDIQNRIVPPRCIQDVHNIDAHLKRFTFGDPHALHEIEIEPNMRGTLDPSTSERAELPWSGIHENQVTLSISNRPVAETRVERLRCCDILKSWICHLLQAREVRRAILPRRDLSDVLGKLAEKDWRIADILRKRGRARRDCQGRPRGPCEDASQLPLFDQPGQPARAVRKKGPVRPERQFIGSVAADGMRTMKVHQGLVERALSGIEVRCGAVITRFAQRLAPGVRRLIRKPARQAFSDLQVHRVIRGVARVAIHSHGQELGVGHNKILWKQFAVSRKTAALPRDSR